MKMAHVTIMTKRMEESVAFYENAAGLKILRDMRHTDHPIVFMAEEAGDTCIELVENPKGAYEGNGLLVGFLVDDAEKEYAKMEAMGLCPGQMVSPNPHARFFVVKDPNGVDIQFLQETEVL